MPRQSSLTWSGLEMAGILAPAPAAIGNTPRGAAAAAQGVEVAPPAESLAEEAPSDLRNGIGSGSSGSPDEFQPSCVEAVRTPHNSILLRAVSAEPFGSTHRPAQHRPQERGVHLLERLGSLGGSESVRVPMHYSLGFDAVRKRHKDKQSSAEASTMLARAIEALTLRIEDLGRSVDEQRAAAERREDQGLLSMRTNTPIAEPCFGAYADGGTAEHSNGGAGSVAMASCGPGAGQRVLQVLESIDGHLQQLQARQGDEVEARKRELAEELREEHIMQAQVLGDLVAAVRSLKSQRNVAAPRSSTHLESAWSRCEPRYRPYEGSDNRIYEFPEVQVALKVCQVCNVNTAQMTYEIDLLCRLDWCDTNVEGLSNDELRELDWSRYFNPRVEIDNCKDLCAWMPGADEVPRRRGRRGSILVSACSTEEERAMLDCRRDAAAVGECGPWLRKTMRFRGTLSLSAVNLKCFPFDIQVLPVKLKAARCRGLALGTPRLEPSAGEQIHKVHLVDAGLFPPEAGYWETSPHLRSRGHFALPAADDSLLEFNISGLTGCRPEPQRVDTYEVHILVERPKFASYVWDIVIMNLLVLLSATAFWDTAAPELSSRMSISLTVILTLAAYTSSRPAPIEKAPYVTFHDWCEQVCMLLVTCISVQNVFAVVLCGGQHEEAPVYMVEMFEQNQEICSVGWCLSRRIDCRGLIVLVVVWLLLWLYSILWLLRTRKSSIGLWARLLNRSCACTPQFDGGGDGDQELEIDGKGAETGLDGNNSVGRRLFCRRLVMMCCPSWCWRSRQSCRQPLAAARHGGSVVAAMVQRCAADGALERPAARPGAAPPAQASASVGFISAAESPRTCRLGGNGNSKSCAAPRLLAPPARPRPEELGPACLGTPGGPAGHGSPVFEGISGEFASTSEGFSPLSSQPASSHPGSVPTPLAVPAEGPAESLISTYMPATLSPSYCCRPYEHLRD